MGGTIDVISHVARGSTFTIQLPLRRAPAIAEAVANSGSEPSAAMATPKILLVEDIPANVLIAQHYLDEFGLTYEVATDGAQAVARILAGETYDAILMDVQMPIMDGREATRRIRIYERDTARTPHQIIAVTAHAMADDREKCLAAGMDDYLSKPFETQALEQKLIRAIAAKRKSEARFLGEVVGDDGGDVSRDAQDHGPAVEHR